VRVVRPSRLLEEATCTLHEVKDDVVVVGAAAIEIALQAVPATITPTRDVALKQNAFGRVRPPGNEVVRRDFHDVCLLIGRVADQCWTATASQTAAFDKACVTPSCSYAIPTTNPYGWRRRRWSALEKPAINGTQRRGSC
jgi:hypothetical protein